MGKKRTNNSARDADEFHQSDIIDASNPDAMDDSDANIGTILLDIVKDADLDRLLTLHENASTMDLLVVVMNWMHKWQQEYQCIMGSLTQYLATLNSNLEDNEELEDNTAELNEMETEGVQVITGFEKITLALIRSNDMINVDVLDDMGWTLLMQAANCGSRTFVHELVKNHAASISLRQHKEPFGMHALARAVDAGHVTILDLLISDDLINSVFTYKSQDEVDGDLENHTPLTLACRCGHEDMIDYLLSQEGLNINHQLPESQDTALHIATCFDMEGIVQKLLSHPSIDVNAVNSQGYTAAFGCSNANLVQTLLSHGLDASLEGIQGESLLDMALALGDGDVATVIQDHLDMTEGNQSA